MKTMIKKGVMSEVIGVFILILIIAVLAGMTFLFTSNLFTQAYASDKTAHSATSVNESLASPTTAGISLAVGANERDGECGTLISVINATGDFIITSSNWTQTGCTVVNTTNWVTTGGVRANWSATMLYTYPYTYNRMGSASDAINETETAGASVINYLPLLFLALIFGAVLAVVLKIILPYINLGNQVSGM